MVLRDCTFYGNVFPTPVGMVRSISPASAQRAGFPHARGDGPACAVELKTSDGFSPRPWGWSVKMTVALLW